MSQARLSRTFSLVRFLFLLLLHLARPSASAPTPASSRLPTLRHAIRGEGEKNSDNARICPTLLPTERVLGLSSYDKPPRPPTLPPTLPPALPTALPPTLSPNRAGSHAAARIARSPRIIGGALAAPGLERSVVLLVTSYGSCSGVLIAPLLVASAAHCGAIKGSRVYFLSRAIERAAPSGPARAVAGVSVPPGFDAQGTGAHDIVVARLDRPAPAGTVPMLVNSDPALPRPASAVRVAGYGTTRFNDGVASGNLNVSLLHQVDLPVVPTPECKRMNRGDIHVHTANDFCAGYRRGTCDSCKGDSGGPLFQYNAVGRRVLVGVVSRGFGCALPRRPSVNTRVTAYPALFADVSIQRSAGAVQVPVGEAERFPTPSPSPNPAPAGIGSAAASPRPQPTDGGPQLPASPMPAAPTSARSPQPQVVPDTQTEAATPVGQTPTLTPKPDSQPTRAQASAADGGFASGGLVIVIIGGAALLYVAAHAIYEWVYGPCAVVEIDEK